MKSEQDEIGEKPVETYSKITVESMPIAVLSSGNTAETSEQTANLEQDRMWNEQHYFWIALTVISCFAIFSLALSTYAIVKHKRSVHITPCNTEPKA